MPHHVSSDCRSLEPTPTPTQGDDGWIHVKPRSRLRGGGPKSRYVKPPRESAVQHTPKPLRQDTLRSPEDIAAEYHRVRSRWEDDAACQELRRRVQEDDIPSVSRAVCLGIGTFDPPDGGWETKRRTFVQLIAFLVLVESLGWSIPAMLHGPHSSPTAARSADFLEPVFTPSDKKFIESLGHQVVESPGGFDKIDDSSMLFGVHLYRPIYAKALDRSLPAIFVGTDLDVWDWVTLGQTSELASVQNVKVIEETYAKREFPQDASSTAFSSTSWYWRRPDKGSART
ncbi:hypothetical protein ACRE_076920 [Hapsidospora chrysogenum ATCC 11550]|uniref:SRR1-like domain-containing protein n=1 Tax=Hapsidospora chrysogenum (strain ATCC 11550 / CBS 779.69 / DSM 880 / IAM 14645 / JCM 23072 / IMI 49137) TaxID=857340 RepID=A0A086SWV3_HAPC1|nr:hypothetical protein ACRE_076920 [Hapsidospora chrysogenum ATCC 11550]